MNFKHKPENYGLMPKLSADIFNHPWCPDWVEYAAVNKDGTVWGFASEPVVCIDEDRWVLRAEEHRDAHFIAEGFYASDWSSFLVQRLPETMPEPEETDGKLTVRFKKLHPEAKAPYQASPGSAGWDLTAVSVEPVKEDAFLCRYGTGLAVEIPQGHVGLLFPRSSVYKAGQLLTNCVGVIDSDYRGEITAVFAGPHTGNNAYQPGDRFAQLVIMPIPTVKFEEAEELTETKRGTGGYGSTGK